MINTRRWIGSVAPRVYETRTTVALPLPRVFEFFAEADNLERITPEFLRFEILTPKPIEIRQGTLIDYRIRLFGVPMLWQTEITVWEPPYRFVDTQLRGPYRKWVHEHRFQACPFGTDMVDRVEYEIPAGPLEPLIQAWFVGPSVQRIFDHRSEAIRQLLKPTDDA